jgi:hypothetical protein
MTRVHLPTVVHPKPPWNRGRILGQKRPLLPKHVWAIRVRLELSGNLRDLALFNLAIDSKLRGCDLVRLKVSDLVVGGVVRERVTITQSKTGHPVQFEVGDLAESDQRLVRAAGDDRISLPLPEPVPRRASHLHPAVRPDGAPMGDLHRPGAERVWHALDEADEGGPDLSEDRQPAGGPIAPRAYQDGQHREVPRG